MTDTGSTPPRTQATVTRSRWPGWIWAVPIAALAIIAWLGIRALAMGGADITIAFNRADGVKKETKIEYLGMDVGTISSIGLSDDKRSVVAHASIQGDAARELRSGTRFYLKNAKPSLSDLSSLQSVLSGPTIEMVPGQGTKARHFQGIIGQPPEKLAAPVLFEVEFNGDVGGIKEGDPVKMRGFTIGDIVKTSLDIANDGKISTPLILALDASRFHLSPSPDKRDAATRLVAALSALVRNGLRARLAQDPPLIGQPAVTLEFVKDASPAALNFTHPNPEIPAEEGGAGLSVLAKLNSVPIDRIADNVRDITDHIRTIVASPNLNSSIEHLNATMTQLNKVVDRAGPQLTSTIDEMRKTVAQIDSTVATAQSTIGGTTASTNGNLQQSLRELTDAARSLRSLADELDRHPEAIIRGR